MRKYILMIVAMFMLYLVGCSNKPHVIIQTNMGEIELELDGDSAPEHVKNFLKLVGKEFYAGTTFHRIVPGFIIQGGDPNSKDMDKSNDGIGGPGYTIPAEIKLKHKKGALAAARQPDSVNPKKRSSGSQFYICLQDLPQLDRGGYTVFGKVVKGMDVVNKIARVKTDARDNPIRRVVMERVYLK